MAAQETDQGDKQPTPAEPPMNRTHPGVLSSTTRSFATLAFCLAATLAFAQSAHAAIIPTGDVAPVYDNSDPWDLTGNILLVGGTGVGTLEINSGSSVNSLISSVGNQTTGDGVLTVTGANSILTATSIVSIGGSGTGELNVEAGGLVEAGGVAMAGGSSALSEATVTGANSQLSATGIMVVGGAINPFTGDIGPGGDATLTVNSGGAVTVGDAATPLGSSLVVSDADMAGGALTVFSGGQINLAGQAVIGKDLSESGSATLTGEGAYLSTGGNAAVGSSGTGTLNVEAGADVDVGNILNIGLEAGSTGTTTVTGVGSTLDTIDDLNVGSSGNGTLNILDGATVRTGILSAIGSQAGSTGEVTVSGAGSHWETDYAFLEPGTVIIINSGLDVGAFGDGTLNIEDGGRVSSGIAVIAAGEDSVGTATVTGAGSRWNIPNRFQVGGGGNGTLTIEDGGVVNSGGESYVGSFAEGEVTVTGAGSEWNHNATLAFGFAGSGTVTVEDGGEMTNDGVTSLGFFPDSAGMVTITGAGSRWENNDNVSVGIFGSGTIDIDDGGVAALQGLGIAADVAGVGVVTVRDANSQLRIRDNLVVGGSVFDNSSGGDGTLNIESGGRVRLNDTDTVSNLEALDISGDGPMPMDGVTMTVFSGGTVNNYASAVVGSNPGEYGTAIVTGSGATWNNGGTLTVGFLGTGTLAIEDGGVVTSVDGKLGEFVVGSGNATVTGAGSRWDLSGELEVGLAGTGTLTIESGGRVSVGDAAAPATSGSLVISDADSGSGGVTVLSGGQINNTAGRTVIADAQGEFGNVSFSGSGAQLNQGFPDDVIVGRGGAGTLDLQDGAAATAGSFILGELSTGHGTMNVQGNAVVNSNVDIVVGQAGVGVLNVDSAQLANPFGFSVIGAAPGSEGTATVAGEGATWSMFGSLTVGNSGTGTLNIENGGVVSGSLAGGIGAQPSGVGTVTVTGGGSRWNMFAGGSPFFVGGSGEGTLMIENGGVVDTAVSLIGASSGGHGTATVTGPGSRWENFSLSVGFISEGELTIADGGVVTAATTEIAFDPGSTGTVTVTDSGSLLSVRDELAVGGQTSAAGGAGTLNIEAGGLVAVEGIGTIQEGGVVNLGDGQFTIDVNATNNGSLNIASGMFTVGGDFANTAAGGITGQGALNIGGVFTNAGTIESSGGQTDIHGAFVNEAGGSVLTSAGAITTFFDSVEHNGSAIETSPGSITEFLGPYSGAGSFTGDGFVRFEDTVDLGNSTASVSFAGDVSLASVATTIIEIGGLLAGEFDQFVVAGDFEIDGTLDVDLINPITLNAGDAFSIITAAEGITGEFVSGLLPTLGGGLGFEVIYRPASVELLVVPLNGDFDADGDVDVADALLGQRWGASLDGWAANFGTAGGPLVGAAAVPEPTSAALLLIGLLAFTRRR